MSPPWGCLSDCDLAENIIKLSLKGNDSRLIPEGLIYLLLSTSFLYCLASHFLKFFSFLENRILYMKELEEGDKLTLDFTKLQKVAATGHALLPVVVQDADTKEVLVVAYANQQALEHTLESGLATFWSSSRNELWIKGKTSGDELRIVEIRVNCEQNSLLYLVHPVGEGTCHTKTASGKSRKSCYYRKLSKGALQFIETY